MCAGEQEEKLKSVYEKWDSSLFSEESFNQYLEKAINKLSYSDFSAEEEDKAKQQEQKDLEFEERVFREKCPTCLKQCSWYTNEKERRTNG